MIIQTFVQIPFIKINQRFGDAATRTRKTSEHFERTKRLLGIEIVVAIVAHQKKRN